MNPIPLVDESRLVTLVNDPTTTSRRWDDRAACADLPQDRRPLLPGRRRPAADGGAGPVHHVPGRPRVPRHRPGPRVRGGAPLRLVGWLQPRGARAPRRAHRPPHPARRDRRCAGPADLARHLRRQNRTIPSIAAELGCTERTVYRYLASSLRPEDKEHHHGQDHRRDPASPTAAAARGARSAPAVRRAAERLQEQFNLSPDAAEAFASAVVDPAEIRKAADNPEQLYVPGGTLYGLRARVWTRPRDARPAQPAGRARPSSPHRRRARDRPRTRTSGRSPSPTPIPTGDPSCSSPIESREHLTWSSVIAKKYILKDNDWRLSIRNQGVMTEVWLSAVTLVHGDGTAHVTVPVTSEGSSRLPPATTSSTFAPPTCPTPATTGRCDRSSGRSTRWSPTGRRSSRPRRSAARRSRRCCSSASSRTRARRPPSPPRCGRSSRCATSSRRRRGTRRRRWARSPTPYSRRSPTRACFAPTRSSGYSGRSRPRRPRRRGSRPTRPCAPPRIVRLLTDTDPAVHQTIRVAITGQTTKQRITNKFKLEVAAALILRAVSGADEGQKVSDIYRALQTGFADSLASEPWQATYRHHRGGRGERAPGARPRRGNGPASLELAARAAYPLDREPAALPRPRAPRTTTRSTAVSPARSSTACATTELGRSASSARRSRTTPTADRIRAVSPTGEAIPLDNGDGDQLVTDNWLRQTFPPPGDPSPPPRPTPPTSATWMPWRRSARPWTPSTAPSDGCVAVEGVDGRPLIETEGVDPADADAWMDDLMKLMQRIPVWRATHVAASRRRRPLVRVGLGRRRVRRRRGRRSTPRRRLGGRGMTTFTTRTSPPGPSASECAATSPTAEPIRRSALRRRQLPRGAGRRRPLPSVPGRRTMTAAATLAEFRTVATWPTTASTCGPPLGTHCSTSLSGARARRAHRRGVARDADDLVDRLRTDLGLGVVRLACSRWRSPRSPRRSARSSRRAAMPR